MVATETNPGSSAPQPPTPTSSRASAVRRGSQVEGLAGQLRPTDEQQPWAWPSADGMGHGSSMGAQQGQEAWCLGLSQEQMSSLQDKFFPRWEPTTHGPAPGPGPAPTPGPGPVPAPGPAPTWAPTLTPTDADTRQDAGQLLAKFFPGVEPLTRAAARTPARVPVPKPACEPTREPVPEPTQTSAPAPTDAGTVPPLCF